MDRFEALKLRSALPRVGLNHTYSLNLTITDHQYRTLHPKFSLAGRVVSDWIWIKCSNFHVDDGFDVEVGFLKIFASTEYEDYALVEQMSPFDHDTPRALAKISWVYREPIWDSKVITIVQQKQPQSFKYMKMMPRSK